MEKVRMNEKGLVLAGSLFLGGIVLAIIFLTMLIIFIYHITHMKK